MKLKIEHFLDTRNARFYIDGKELEKITHFSISGRIGTGMRLHVESDLFDKFWDESYDLTDFEVVKGVDGEESFNPV